MKKGLFIILYILTPISLTWVIYQANPDHYQSLWSISSMVFGTVAYAWIQWQFILSSRPKWLEKGIGMDYFYRFHGMMALVTIGLGFIHGQLKEQVYGESFMTRLGTGALIIFASISVLSLLVMVTSKLHNIHLINQLKTSLQKIKWLKYEQLKKYHNLTVIGQVMVVIHVLMTRQVRESYLSFVVYMGLFLIAFGHYVFHKVYRSWLMTYHPLEVEALEKVPLDSGENPRYMWHVHMMSAKGRISYEPGQFAFFRFLRNGKFEEHPFSIASSPTEETLTISVKQLGDFTTDMGGLTVGSQLIMDGPYGAFSYKFHKKEDGIIFFVAGIGITPAMGMIRHMKSLKEQRPITLIWQLRSVDEAVFLNELAAYKKEMKGLDVQLFVDDMGSNPNPDSSIQLHPGRIKEVFVHQLIDDITAAKKAYGYYVCGPSGYMTLIKNSLTQAGIKKQHIHYESFSF